MLGSCTDNGDGSFTGECAKAWGDSRITLSKRTVAFDLANRTVVVTDEVKCDASLTPHVCWNMPEHPLAALPSQIPGFVSLSNAILQFTPTPVVQHVIGGFGHEIDGLDGKSMASDITPMDNDWLGLSVADKLRSGGAWRVQCEMAAGGGTMTTKIVVN